MNVLVIRTGSNSQHQLTGFRSIRLEEPHKMQSSIRAISVAAVLCLLQTACSKHPTPAAPGTPAKATTTAPAAAAPAAAKPLRHPDMIALDINNDGKLTLDEWTGPAVRRFQKFTVAGAANISLQSAYAGMKMRRDAAKNTLEHSPMFKSDNPAVQRKVEPMKKRLTAEAAQTDETFKTAAQELMTRYDLDHDGKLTPEEWLTIPREQFTAADTNQDKSLSNDELVAYSKATGEASHLVPPGTVVAGVKPAARQNP
jgi:hypothetical protein